VVFLTGDSTGRKMVEKLKGHGWGRLWVSNPFTPYDGEPWGVDSGAYRDWKTGEETDWGKYSERCWEAHEAGGCYMAVLPDIVAAGQESYDFSMEAVDRFNLPRALPWYFAVQDGLGQPLHDEMGLDWIHGIFLGGSNSFKLQAPWWAGVAHSHGKRFHYGRAGTPHKVSHALRVGADSCDSAFPLWNYDRLDHLALIVAGEKPQIELEFV
jgi:hypothetical protein